VTLRRGLCVFFFLSAGRLTWSISLLCCVTYVLYDLPQQPWRFLSGLALGSILLAGAALLVGEKRLSTFLGIIYHASAISSLLLVIIIGGVWLRHGLIAVEWGQVLFLLVAVGVLASYCVLYQRRPREKESLPALIEDGGEAQGRRRTRRSRCNDECQPPFSK